MIRGESRALALGRQVLRSLGMGAANNLVHLGRHNGLARVRESYLESRWVLACMSPALLPNSIPMLTDESESMELPMYLLD